MVVSVLVLVRFVLVTGSSVLTAKYGLRIVHFFAAWSKSQVIVEEL